MTPGPARAATLIGFAALYAYFNSLHGSFIFDDPVFTDDPNIGRPWASALWNRPVVAWTLALNYWADGLNTRGYHVFNLAVHAAAAFVLYDLVRRVLLLPRFGEKYAASAGWVGLAAGLVWLVHPLNTQSVTYIVQRCESLMGLLYLAAVWCFLRGAAGGCRWWYAAAAGCGALACGCKEVATTLPAVLVLFDRAFLAGSWRGVLRRWPAYLLIGLIPTGQMLWIVFGGLVGGKTEGTVGLAVRLFTPTSYALTQTEVIWHYLRLAAWPTGLTLDYLDWPERKSLADVWLPAGALAALVAGVTYGVLRNRAWAMPAAAFFVILAPTSSIVPIQDAAFEHRMYLPLACLVALAVVGVAGPAARLPKYPRAVAAAGLVALLGLLSVVRNEDYSTNYQMFQDNVAKRPENPRTRGAYADLLRQRGEFDAAREHIQEAVKLPRNTAGNACTLANVLLALGEADAAALYIRDVHAQSPTDPMLNQMYGITLLAGGKAAEAVAPLVVARDAKPGNTQVLLQLGLAQAESGDEPAAARTFADLKTAAPEMGVKIAAQAREAALAADTKPIHLRMSARLAAAARRLNGPADPAALDASALVAARLGNFPAAVTFAEAAVAAAETAGWPADKLALLRERVGLFKAKKPYLPADLAAYRGVRS